MTTTQVPAPEKTCSGDCGRCAAARLAETVGALTSPPGGHAAAGR